MENVLRLDQSCTEDADQTDLDVILNFISAELGDLYTVMILKGLDPTAAGFPVQRPRVAIFGGRKDQIQGDKLGLITTKLINEPVPITMNYRQLLGLCPTTIAWDNLWATPGPQAQLQPIATGCACCADPYVICPVHACGCKHCKSANGTD